MLQSKLSVGLRALHVTSSIVKLKNAYANTGNLIEISPSGLKRTQVSFKAQGGQEKWIPFNLTTTIPLINWWSFQQVIPSRNSKFQFSCLALPQDSVVPAGIDQTSDFGNRRELLRIPLDLSELQRKQIDIYVDNLIEWNQVMNLTAVTGRPAIMERHVADSILLVPLIENAWMAAGNQVQEGSGKLRVVDVGTGAGLPGIMLAVVRPEWQVTLLESLSKRCNFLEHVVGLMALKNVNVECGRAELLRLDHIQWIQLIFSCQDAARGPMRESYDVATARAVAELRVLAELCMPLVRVGGVFVAPKGPNPEEEVSVAISAVSLLGGSSPSLIEVDSKGPGGQRTAVICNKVNSTPSKYPRRAGMPNKRPL